MSLPDYKNPDGTFLYRGNHFIYNDNGSINMLMVIDRSDKSDVERIENVNQELAANLEALFQAPQFPKLAYFERLKKSLEEGGMGLTELVDSLVGEESTDTQFRSKRPTLEQVFEKIIVPYFDQVGVKLQDYIRSHDNRDAAVSIIDSPRRETEPGEAPLFGYPIGDEDRIDKELIQKDHYETKYFFEDGRLANYKDLAMIRARVTERRKEGAKTSNRAQKIDVIKTLNDKGELHDMDIMEFAKSSLGAVVIMNIAKEQNIQDKMAIFKGVSKVRENGDKKFGNMLREMRKEKVVINGEGSVPSVDLNSMKPKPKPGSQPD